MSALHGLLLVNKPSGITSHDVVAKVRKIFNTKSVGHTGTLDPLASGMMVLLLGEATKLSQYILEGDKSYRVGLRLGVRTDTLDITGTVVDEKPLTQTGEQVRQAAFDLMGEREFAVPLYSAVKIQGQKLYEYARNQQDVQAPMKLMKFWDIRYVEGERANWVFELNCSKGSYIRTWVDELGKQLGCGATMTSLVRTWSDPYFLNEAQSLEEIEQQWTGNHSARALIPLEAALPKIKKVRVKGMDQKLLKNGQISHDLRVQIIQVFNPQRDQIVQVFSQETGALLALIGLDPGKGFVIRRVLNI